MSLTQIELDKRLFLVGIGAQKTGTSWLSTYFKSHPEIFMSPIKEMHFFGDPSTSKQFPPDILTKRLEAAMSQAIDDEEGALKRVNTLLERIDMGHDITLYKQFMANRVRNESTFCEITPAYSMLPESEYKRIYDNFPKVKFIYIMRNPVDRFWSQFKFSENNLTTETLEPRLLQCLNEKKYLKRSDYQQTLQTIYSVVPGDKVLVLFYEQLFTKSTVQRICKFAGISYQEANLSMRKNFSLNLPLPLPLRKQVFDRLRTQYEFIHKMYCESIPESWKLDVQNYQ